MKSRSSWFLRLEEYFNVFVRTISGTYVLFFKFTLLLLLTIVLSASQLLAPPELAALLATFVAIISCAAGKELAALFATLGAVICCTWRAAYPPILRSSCYWKPV
jgi:hypothetical protein